jgi:hypothetical protein
MEGLFWALVAAGIAFGISRGVTAKLRENEYNKKLKAYLDSRDEAFRNGFLPGRRRLFGREHVRLRTPKSV